MRGSRVAAVAAAVLFALPAAAAGPAVVELFTSQGCYSCPAADRALGRLIAERPDVVGLEYHVDYWDDLVYGSAGRWRDPFSSPDHTRRQRDYNGGPLEGRRGVYTPQAVVNGRYGAVGSRKGVIEELIGKGRAESVVVTVDGGEAAGLDVTVSGGATGRATVWLVRFDRHRVTEVPSGENQGKTLENHHIVSALDAIGIWKGEAITFRVADLALGDGEGCAILVQRDGPREILGAAYCPG